jgi:hypothetical protein
MHRDTLKKELNLKPHTSPNMCKDKSPTVTPDDSQNITIPSNIRKYKNLDGEQEDSDRENQNNTREKESLFPKLDLSEIKNKVDDTVENDDILNNINDLDIKNEQINLEKSFKYSEEKKEVDESSDSDDSGFMVPANPNDVRKLRGAAKIGLNFSLNKSEQGKTFFEKFDYSTGMSHVINDSEVSDNQELSSQININEHNYPQINQVNSNHLDTITENITDLNIENDKSGNITPTKTDRTNISQKPNQENQKDAEKVQDKSNITSEQ